MTVGLNGTLALGILVGEFRPDGLVGLFEHTEAEGWVSVAYCNPEYKVKENLSLQSLITQCTSENPSS